MQERFSRLEKQGHPLNTSSQNIQNTSIGGGAGMGSKKQATGVRRLMFNNKCSLKSHIDSIRGLHFLPHINGLVSSSEDCTVKVWDVTKFASMKDVEGVVNFEPYLTLRGHREPIMCLSGRNNISNMG
jgi:WD40 repeat protein